MGVGVKVNVWGDYAPFTRPELKTERYSYDIITPLSGTRYFGSHLLASGNAVDHRQNLCQNPIQFTSVRRNEVISKISKIKC